MPESSATGSVKVLPVPTKSGSDKKEYKAIQLPNGLRALLISDTSYDLEKLDEEEALENESDDMETDGDDDDDDGEGEEMEAPSSSSSGLKKSAAGLSINMGSFSDLPELQGLAHFLEHMVFMGSSKYPDENAFDQFIQKHGGCDNAHTDCELTTFFFEVQRKNFSEALDRFAQFFIDPLMKKEAMQREREAVDSEFQMSLPSDSCRRSQIVGTVMAKEGHPMGKFMWGNLKSLQMGDLTDDEVHKKLHAFRLRHYSAHSMTLTVQSQETMETLEKWVVGSFSAVPNNGLERESFKSAGDPFSEKFNRLYRIVPTQDVYELDLSWSLPPLLDKYRTDPLNYMSHVVGHEGKGSLVSHLRDKVWALSLAAGNGGDGFDMNETYSSFTISIVLTKGGHEHVDEVISAVFSYLKMFRSQKPQLRIFGEMKKIKELDFEFGPEPQPIENVENICEGMHLYPPEMYLTGGELIFDFDEKLIDDCVQMLGEDGVNVCLTSKDCKDGATKVEPWFKTRYVDTEFTNEQIRSWKEAPLMPEVFFLPEPNIFIAKDVSLLSEPAEIPRYPTQILKSPLGELFYKQDTTFKKPRAIAAFNLLSSMNEVSLENAVCLDLFVNSLDQLMIEDVYPASQALLDYAIQVGERGEICIRVSGLNDKLPTLLKTILIHWKSFEQTVTDGMFVAVKEQTKKNYFNYIIKPSKMVREVRMETLQEVFWPASKKHEVVSKVTLDQLKAFLREFCKSKNVFVQGLFQGNVSKESSLQMFDSVCELIEKTGSFLDDLPAIKCKELPEGSTFVRINGFNPKDTNTLVTNYYQAGPGNLKLFSLLEIVAMLMEEPVFDVLRTKEQLGYAVFSMLRNTYGVLAVSVTVNSQANKFTADHVDERIEAFLKWFLEDKMKSLEQDEFDETVATLVKLKKSADVTLRDEFTRNWDEVVQREYAFDRLERSVETLEACTMKEAMEIVAKIIEGSRRKLSSQVVGNPEGIAMQEEEAAADDVECVDADPNGVFRQTYVKPEEMDGFVEDVAAFKSKLKTFPVCFITK